MSVNEDHTGLRPDRPPTGMFQCYLTRAEGNAELRQVAWLPARLAKRGQTVHLCDGPWLVAEVWGAR